MVESMVWRLLPHGHACLRKPGQNRFKWLFTELGVLYTVEPEQPNFEAFPSQSSLLYVLMIFFLLFLFICNCMKFKHYI